MPIDDLPSRRSAAGMSAVITGRASGIGLATARLLLASNESGFVRTVGLAVDGGRRRV